MGRGRGLRAFRLLLIVLQLLVGHSSRPLFRYLGVPGRAGPLYGPIAKS